MEAERAGMSVTIRQGRPDHIDWYCRKIHRGDCIDVMKGMPSESMDMVFADPPYNLSGKSVKLVGNKTGGDFYAIDEKWDKIPESEYAEFTKEWIRRAYGLLTHRGSMYVCCTFHNMDVILNAVKQSKMNVKNVITWKKTNAMPSVSKRTFTHSTEFIIYATKNSRWTFNYSDLKRINPERQKNGDEKQMRDVWEIPITQGRQRLRQKNGRALHPAQKPEELVRRSIIASTNKDDVVLDPFMGTGTTAVVAKQERRRWIGIERDADYRKHAMARIKRVKVL